MLTALQKQGSLIPVSAKNADEDSKPLLDNIGRTASVCDAIFVRELPDFTGGWSRNKGFSPRISAPVSNVAGFEQPPALIVLKNDLGGFVQIFNIGGLYDEFNQISEQRAGSHQHQRHSIFKGEPDWFRLEFILSAKGNSIFTNRIKCASVFIELEKLNHTDAAPESMRYIYARISCREVANKATPNKRARCDRVFQLPTPDGFRLPMKKEITNAKYHQISEQRTGSYRHQRHPVFKGSPNWGHLAISQRLPFCSENFSTAQKRIYSGYDAFNRTADERGQTTDKCIFGTRSGSDRDVRANARRVAIPRLYLGRFGRQTINQSPSGTDECPQGGAVAALPRMGKDSSLSSGGAFGQRNRKSHREKPNNGQYGVTAYARLRISRPFGFGTQIRSAFLAVRRVKQWGKSLNCPKSGFINPTSAVKLKKRLKTVKSLLKIWTSPLKSAKSLTAFNPLTFISPCRFQRRQGFLCLKGI